MNDQEYTDEQKLEYYRNRVKCSGLKQVQYDFAWKRIGQLERKLFRELCKKAAGTHQDWSETVSDQIKKTP